MTTRRLLPYSAAVATGRGRGQVPRLLGGAQLAVVFRWDERRTGAVHRLVMIEDPTAYDLRCLAGLHVRVAYTATDADRVAGAVDALLAAGAASVECVNHDLIAAGAPRDAWLSLYQREELRHAA